MSFPDFTFFDYVIIATVGLLVTIGFFAGVTRIAIGLLAMYLATVISAAFYDDLADWLRDSIGSMGVAVSELTAFMVLFLLLTVGLFLAVSHTSRAFEVRRGRLSILDNLGGAALAISAGILAMATTLSIAVIILGAFFNQSSTSGGLENLGALGDSIRDSELVPRVLKLQPGVSVVFEPWFPNGLPPILQPPPGL